MTELLPLLGAMRNPGRARGRCLLDVLLPLLGAMRNNQIDQRTSPVVELLPLLGAMRNTLQPQTCGASTPSCYPS